MCTATLQVLLLLKIWCFKQRSLLVIVGGIGSQSTEEVSPAAWQNWYLQLSGPTTHKTPINKHVVVKYDEIGVTQN